MLSYEEEEQLKACLKANSSDLTPTTVTWLIKALNETHTELVNLYNIMFLTEDDMTIIQKALRHLQDSGLTKPQARQKMRYLAESQGISKLSVAKRILADAE